MKAIIPAAGYGTRFLPATKAIPKEMLPVGAKPAIQLIAEEASAAGADEIVIVVSPDKPALRKHFTPDAAWRERLRGKPEADAAMAELDALSGKIRFVSQAEQRGLGHAILQAAPLCEGEREPVLILLGDALVAPPLPGGDAPALSASAALVEASRAFGNASVVGLERVPREKVSRYGVIAGEPVAGRGGCLFRLSGLVEKPSPAEAPSDLAIAGRYLLQPAIFNLLATQKPGKGNEIQLTDSIVRLLALGPVYGLIYPGRRLDIGNPRGFFEALQAFSR